MPVLAFALVCGFGKVCLVDHSLCRIIIALYEGIPLHKYSSIRFLERGNLVFSKHPYFSVGRGHGRGIEAYKDKTLSQGRMAYK